MHAGALLLLVLLALAPQRPLLAADAIEIHALLGFSDTFRPGHWTPLTVTVTNRGADVSGELEVQVTGEDAARGQVLATCYRSPLALQHDTRKSLHFTLLPQGLFHPLVIRVRSHGRELARSEVDLRTHFAPQRLLLVLARNADLDYLNDGSVDGVRVLYPHPELLPRHWRGYDAVSAVVLHGVSLERLSTSQFEALHKWVAQGGVLAVSGGPDYALLKGARLAALLPAVPVGIAPIAPQQLAQAFSTTFESTRPVYVHRLAQVRGSVRMRAGEVPLVVERSLGRGRVVYLTFDVAAAPFDRWQGMPGLWRETLGLRPAGASALASTEPATSDTLAMLIRAEAADFPGYASAFLFVVLYLGLLYAGHALPGRGRSMTWSASIWLGAPVVFMPLAWLLFGPAAFPRGASAAAVALIEPLPDSGYARLTLELGLYANRSGPLRFEYRGAQPVLQPHRHAQREGKAGDWIFGEGAQPFAQPLAGRRYQLYALEGDDVVAFRLDVAALLEASGDLRITIDNASGRRIDDVRLVFDGHAYRLGTIGAGARFERRLGSADAVAVDSWRSVLAPPAGVARHLPLPAQVLLERKSKAAGADGYPRRGYALLLGYTASPLRPAGASAGWSHHDQTLVALETPVAGAKRAAATPPAGDAAGQAGADESTGNGARTPDRTNDANQPAIR